MKKEIWLVLMRKYPDNKKIKIILSLAYKTLDNILCEIIFNGTVYKTLYIQDKLHVCQAV